MPKKIYEPDTIIIIVESDISKHNSLREKLKSTEGDTFLSICQNIQQAISTLENLSKTRITSKIPPQYELTKREKEVLNLLADGYMYKNIAKILSISLGSVKQYIHIIYQKLSVSNRTEAVNKYFGHPKI